MGYLKEIFQDIDGMDKRPEIKGSKFEKFVLAPTIKQANALVTQAIINPTPRRYIFPVR